MRIQKMLTAAVVGLSAIALFPLTAASPLQTNHPPTVKIEAPANNAALSADASLNYQIQVTDQEDGDSRYDEINTKEVLLEVAQLKSGPQIPAVKGDTALRVMATNNCFNCHQFNAKSLGPSFFEIAKRYPANTANADSLINRIRNGSSGIWGRTEKMPSHPELSPSAIRSTVRWILQSAARSDRAWYFGTTGLLHFNKPGTYSLTATYTDHGTKDQPTLRLTGTDRIIVTVN
jgi:cytochrome c